MVLSLVVLALPLALLWPASGHSYILLDDPQYVFENPHVRGGITSQGLLWSLGYEYAGNWHPLTWWSHMLDVEGFGLDPGPQHLVNVALHALNGVLLFWLLERVLRLGIPGLDRALSLAISAFGALLFAVHPLRLESVVWISERKDVLSAAFWLLAVHAYLRYGVRPRLGRLAPVVLLMLLGLASKPMVVGLPLALLLLDFWPLRRLELGAAPGRWLRLVLEKSPLLLLSATVGWITLLAQRGSGAVSSLHVVDFAGRAANVVVACNAYLLDTVWPAGLAVLYPYPPQGWPAWQVFSSVVLPLALTVAAIVCARRFPGAAVGWSWFLLTLLPVIGLVQVGMQARADRYTYLPHVGLVIALAALAGRLLSRRAAWRPVLALAACLALLGLAASTRHQLGFWRDSRSLFTRALEVTDGNYQAHYTLSLELAHRGAIDEALIHAQNAVALHPGHSKAQDHLGYCLAQVGQTERALMQIREAIRIEPGYAWAHFNLGTVLLGAGRAGEAIESLRRALELDAANAGAWTNLGLALQATGEAGPAEDAFRRAVELEPSLYEARLQLGSILAGRADERAIPQLEAAVLLRPRDARAWIEWIELELRSGRLGAAALRIEELARFDPQTAAALRQRLVDRPTAGGGDDG